MLVNIPYMDAMGLYLFVYSTARVERGVVCDHRISKRPRTGPGHSGIGRGAVSLPVDYSGEEGMQLPFQTTNQLLIASH